MPDKARGIEIYSCFDFERMRLHWNGCGLLLHELCHLIHQFAVPNGLANSKIIDLYHSAKESGLYDEVLRRDWAGLEEETDMGRSHSVVSRRILVDLCSGTTVKVMLQMTARSNGRFVASLNSHLSPFFFCTS